MNLPPCTSAADALALFDSLEVVELAEMTGDWAGSEFPTGHPLDGVLEAYGWEGKRIVSEEDVHPLLFRSGAGTVAVRPGALAPGIPLVMRFPELKSPALGRLLRPLLGLLKTRRSQARLRMTQFRGRVSATIVYDRLPIQDVFRRVDGETLLGLMDMKGMERPFFFLLRRGG